MEDTLLRNPHVGEILRYEFLEELDISVNSLAESLRLHYAYELMEAKRNLGDVLLQIVPIAALH